MPTNYTYYEQTPYWDAWATFHQLKPRKRITLPSGTGLWQPEFPD
ncbi:hypothetical protein ACIU3Q_005559 [Salmonella enterica subsp. enterica serovar Kokomlemle]